MGNTTFRECKSKVNFLHSLVSTKADLRLLKSKTLVMKWKTNIEYVTISGTSHIVVLDTFFPVKSSPDIPKFDLISVNWFRAVMNEEINLANKEKNDVSLSDYSFFTLVDSCKKIFTEAYIFKKSISFKNYYEEANGIEVNIKLAETESCRSIESFFLKYKGFELELLEPTKSIITPLVGDLSVSQENEKNFVDKFWDEVLQLESKKHSLFEHWLEFLSSLLSIIEKNRKSRRNIRNTELQDRVCAFRFLVRYVRRICSQFFKCNSMTNPIHSHPHASGSLYGIISKPGNQIYKNNQDFDLIPEYVIEIIDLVDKIVAPDTSGGITQCIVYPYRCFLRICRRVGGCFVTHHP